MIRIRQIQYSDEFEDIELLQSILFPHCPIVKPETGFWWLAKHKTEIAGFCGMIASNAPKTIYLCRAGVFDQFRGKGLHKRLIRIRLKTAKKFGYKYAVTDTTSNPASANNLIDCGFRMFTPETPWSYSHSCYWKKTL